MEFFAPVLDGIGPAGTLKHAQIHHGEADELVVFPNAERIRDFLTGEGTLTELFAYPGANHGFRGADPDNKKAREDSKARTLAFFAAHL